MKKRQKGYAKWKRADVSVSSFMTGYKVTIKNLYK